MIGGGGSGFSSPRFGWEGGGVRWESGFFEVVDFLTGENAPFAWSEVSDFEVTDAHPDEAFDFVAELIEHQANLAFDSLIESESKMFWAKDFHAFGFGATANDMKAFEEFFAIDLFKGLINDHLIFLIDFVAWVGKGEGEIAVIGDDEETFAVHVEASDVVDSGPV